MGFYSIHLYTGGGFLSVVLVRPNAPNVILPDQPADTLDTCPKLNASGRRRRRRRPGGEGSGRGGRNETPLPADDLERAGILEVLRTDLDYWNSRPDSAKIQVGAETYDAPRLRATTKALLELFSNPMPAEELLNTLKSRFKIYRASADDSTGKTVITGYYEAEIAVAKAPDEAHKYAVHLKPADLVKTTTAMGADFDYGRYDEAGKLVRHYSRAEIHAGRLSGQGLELVWSAHPSQIMLLQIQGSGVLRFPDGDYIRAGFDGANGHPFRSVQKILIDCGRPGMSFGFIVPVGAGAGRSAWRPQPALYLLQAAPGQPALRSDRPHADRGRSIAVANACRWAVRPA